MAAPPMRGTGARMHLAFGRPVEQFEALEASLPKRRHSSIVIASAHHEGNEQLHDRTHARNVRLESRHDDARELDQHRVHRLRLTGPRGHHRGDAHHRAVGAIARQRIPEDVPLHEIFVGEDATALIEPVVDDLRLSAALDEHAVGRQRAARRPRGYRALRRCCGSASRRPECRSAANAPMRPSAASRSRPRTDSRARASRRRNPRVDSRRA